MEEARQKAQQASLVDEVFKRNEAALTMADEELDDEAKKIKEALQELFDGKLEPWPHQVQAIMRLEMERRSQQRKNHEGTASIPKQLPVVILGQLGCGIGKSAILAVYAKYLLTSGATKKVLVCTPSVWVTHQLCGLFRVTKFIEELASSEGIFLFEHKRLIEIGESDLKGTILLVDEVDALLANSELKAIALRADAMIGLSATLGGAVGL